MQKLLALCAAVLCLTLAAAAQDNSAASASGDPGSATARPARGVPSDLFRWQLGINYNYIRFRPPAGSSISMHGFNASLTGYLNDWFGLEGNGAAAWGHTPGSPLSPSQRAKLVFYGGGPHIAYRHNAKLEPWGHALFGGTHLFPRTPGNSTIALGYLVGGGLDVKIGPRLSLRFQSDYLATHFFKVWERNIQVQAGVVFHFLHF